MNLNRLLKFIPCRKQKRKFPGNAHLFRVEILERSQKSFSFFS